MVLSFEVILGGIWETASFILRALGAHDQQNSAESTWSTLLLLLAPLWVNAFVYMVLGRMIYFFLPEKNIFGVKAASVAKYFVWLDVIRIIYRLIEWSAGQSSTTNAIPYHEAYVFCLDALPVFLSMTSLCIVHPGFVLVGQDSDFPKLTRAEKKEQKRVKKASKQTAKEEKKQEKKHQNRTKYALSTVEA
ncbi:MAG: hypothetical protein LQ347_005680, partial [Umbilicaria vellea]